MADVKNQTPMLDPIAYRPEYQADLGWAVLQNADMNLNQYGDDSSAANYNDPAKWGWANQKYTWETTKNSQIAYDPNMTIDKLDPNYKYGWAAQLANSKEANYIASRNDNIASALYNAWTTSWDDVEAFLNTQSGFFDSNFNERQNTINSIYKRLGERQAQENKETEQPETEKKDVRADMEKDLTQEQSRLYWKVTADGWNPVNGIDPLSEWYAINQQIMQGRINKVVALQNMNVHDLANIVYSWTTPYGETAMRDWKKYDQAGYAEYEQALKALYAQDRVDSLTHGAAPEETKSFTESVDKNIENDVSNFEKDNSGPDSKEWASYILNIKLESDKAAQTAKQEMNNIKKDVAEIEAQIEDLPRQAREKFKGDTPDYLVQAFVSNNQQRLQKELSKLESRYNAAAEIYKTEVAEKQREAEFELKQAEYNRAMTNDAFDRQYKMTKLQQDSVQWVDWIPYQFDAATNSYIQLDDVTAITQYNNKVEEMSNYGNSIIGIKTGLECEGYTDNLAEYTAGVRMVGASGEASTTAAEKIAYATGWGYIDENGNIVYGNADVYDLIPQVWDVAVWVWWPYNSTWWHTMYIDKVWTDANGKINFHYTATNKSSKPEEYTVWYEWTKTLDEFMSNGWVWFWNPYKQAKYNNSYRWNYAYSPMQPIIDAKMKWAGISQLANLGTFQEIYTEMYQGIEEEQLQALIEQWEVWAFLQQLAVFYNSRNSGSTSGGANKISDTSLWWLFALSVQQLGAEIENYIAENAWEYSEEAYAWFLKVLRAVEIKLRDESGAAINESERATNFLLYLPKPSDSKNMKIQKMKDMEEYIRRLGTTAWINSKEYIPLFSNLWNRQV